MAVALLLSKVGPDSVPAGAVRRSLTEAGAIRRLFDPVVAALISLRVMATAVMGKIAINTMIRKIVRA